MYAPFILILILAAFIFCELRPAIAGSVGLDPIEQTKILKVPPSGTSDDKSKVPKPTAPNTGVPVENYLFLDQNDLNFNNTSTFDTGLFPASGDDMDDPLKAGQKPVLPSYK